MEIFLNESQVFIGELPNVPGGKLLQFVTPQGIKVTIPLDPKAAKMVAAQLTTGLIIAPGPLANTNGHRN